MTDKIQLNGFAIVVDDNTSLDALKEIMAAADFGDEIFTFVDWETQTPTHINATRLRAYCYKHKHAANYENVAITKELYDLVSQNNGIEREKLTRLSQRIDIIAEPILVATWEDGRTTICDGNHRLVLHYKMGMRVIGALVIPPETWRKFTLNIPTTAKAI